MLIVREGHNVSAEIQRPSPLTDLIEGRNELDFLLLLFCFVPFFSISDVCGAFGVI